MSDSTILWRPDPARVSRSAIAAFIAARQREGVALPSAGEPNAFRALHAWSVEQPAAFWDAVWRDGGVIGTRGAAPAVAPDAAMLPPHSGGPTWFPDAHLNVAENLLRHEGDRLALVAWDEAGPTARLTRDELRREVLRVASGFAALGVREGDCVAGWLPNVVEGVIAMLATSWLGATWTSCSPDFGVEGIVDRFGQTRPVVLLVADRYRYAGRMHDCLARAAEVVQRLPSVRHVVRVAHRGGAVAWQHPLLREWDALGAPGEAAAGSPRRLPFDHPLYVLYSSGTTGLPKCLVHGAGGTLLQHLKEHVLHGDLREDDRIFYFTTLGWMMWNWVVSALATGARVVLYDGAPMPPEEPGILWRFAASEGITVFGTSAKYLALAEKAGLEPGKAHDLGALRAVLSTGSPLVAESFDWVTRAVGPVQVASISGGTDIVSCFVLGNPLEPVRRGEIQGPGLGMAVTVFTPDGAVAPVQSFGELVCTRPFPAMPVAFGNDPDGARYRAAYFERFPGAWHHGDWACRTASGGFVISGRSDATLNPGGVRIGTAEIYRQVEAIEEVLESLVIGQQIGRGADADVRVVLFVRLRDGLTLDEPLRDRIRARIRTGASPHHVPRVVVQVRDLPRTRSGKLSELAVRDVVEGRAVANIGALANPDALAEFRDRPELG